MRQDELDSLCVRTDATLREALKQLDDTGLGILLLFDGAGRFRRTVTDGDIRRLMLGEIGIDETLEALPEQAPIVLKRPFTRREALTIMQEEVVNHLPVVDDGGNLIDLVDRASVDRQILLSTPHMGDTELEYVEEAFRTNWIAPLGPNVNDFEQELAAKVGIKHAVALSSGTAAIHLALRLLDVGPGDVVLCSTLTFIASVNPILYQGAEPILIDSEPRSWNMSPAALERALDSLRRQNRVPKAAIVVSLYGQSADMTPILELCDAYGVPVIEDAAESLGASYKGTPSGTLGRIGVYSFNGNKIITTSGGGALVSNDRALTDRARFLATQARDPAPHYQHSTMGYNYRMSNILAGVGRGQLKVLERRVAARRAVFAAYQNGLGDLDWIRFQPEPNWSSTTRWLTAGVVHGNGSRRSAAGLISHLSANFIEARPVWKPMHLQPLLQSCTYVTDGNGSVSDGLFADGFCLPSSSSISADDLQRVIEAVREYGSMAG